MQELTQSQHTRILAKPEHASDLDALLRLCERAALPASILSADQPSSSTGPGSEKVTTATLQHADGIVHGVGDATQFLGIVAVVVFAFSIASEYSYGTLRNLLVRQPRRLVLLGGSYLAMAAFVALAAVLATVVTAGVSLALAPSNGIDTAAWTSGSHLITEPLKAAANTSLAMIGYGTIGAALAIVLRSPAAAIGVGVRLPGAGGGDPQRSPRRPRRMAARQGAIGGRLRRHALRRLPTRPHHLGLLRHRRGRHRRPDLPDPRRRLLIARYTRVFDE